MSYVQSIFEKLHKIPEGGFEEIETSALLAKELYKMGYDVQTGVAKTGIIATLDSGKPGPVLGVRADMDALRHEVNGKVEYRHTCGHDAHSAMLLAAAKTLMEEGIERGKLLLIFQPAEEILGGARSMVESGKLKELTDIVGIHIRPVQECRVGEATSALWHAAAAPVSIYIQGLMSHGARPHLGINAAETAVLIANAIKMIEADPRIPYSIKVTKINTGEGAGNAIPDSASMYLDVRCQDNDEMEKIIEKLKDAIEHAAKATGAKVEYNIAFKPGATYDPEVMQINAKAIRDVLGDEGLLPDIVTPGSEDFHEFTRNLGIRAGYIGLGAGATPGLHHPDMTFDHQALDYGQLILEQVIRYYLSEPFGEIDIVSKRHPMHSATAFDGPKCT